jgi:hypothetical protein
LTRGYYAVLAEVSLSYSPLQGRLVTCYSPVRRFTQVLLPFLARLACVRHAASVDSEPGSNSRLKPDASPVDGGQPGSAASLLLRRAVWDALPCETDQAKPDRISRLARSTKLSKILEGDPPERDPWDRGEPEGSFVLELESSFGNYFRFDASRNVFAPRWSLRLEIR